LKQAFFISALQQPFRYARGIASLDTQPMKAYENVSTVLYIDLKGKRAAHD